MLNNEVPSATDEVSSSQEVTIRLGMMETSVDQELKLEFPVSESLREKLQDQYSRVRDNGRIGNPVERYRAARAAGVLAAVAKGVRSRAFRDGELFIPQTELDVSEGKVRITALKATLILPAGLRAKNVIFRFTESGVTGLLTVSPVQR